MEIRETATRLLQAALINGQVKLNPGLDPIPQLANLWKQLRAELKREPAPVTSIKVKKVLAVADSSTASGAKAKKKA